MGILRPLGIRDFALLWAGATVSLAGDGVYVVALAWQVYELSNSPGAFAGRRGLDAPGRHLRPDRRRDLGPLRRRRIMIADLVRAVAVATIGVLAHGRGELWHLIVLAAVFGTGEAFFGPAFTSIVPEIVPRHLLLQANSLDQFIRPSRFSSSVRHWAACWSRRSGLDRRSCSTPGTFLVSATAIFLMRYRPAPLVRRRSGRDAARPPRRVSRLCAHTPGSGRRCLRRRCSCSRTGGPWRCSSRTACGTSSAGTPTASGS